LAWAEDWRRSGGRARLAGTDEGRVTVGPAPSHVDDFAALMEGDAPVPSTTA